LPPTHRQFLVATELSVSLGDDFFCHAGARPGAPRSGQSAEGRQWNRRLA
jgi:serine/threonine protein phosphatase 1